MLIERLAFKDFLVFPGEQELRFSFESGQNVSLILAPNNTGKTTVIRSLEFLLYGETDREKLARLPCHARLASMSRGEEEECWVEVTLHDGEESLRVRRSLSFVRHDEDSLEAHPIDSQLEVYKIDELTDRLVPHSTSTADKIANLVPRAMFDFYFFKGEELAEKLLQSEAAEIPGHLKKVLYQREWDRVQETLDKAKRSFDRQISTRLNKAKEYNELQLARDGLAQGLKKLEEQLDNEKNVQRQLNSSWREADARIAELAGRADPARRRELDGVKERLGAIAKSRRGLDSRRRAELGSSSALLLAGKVFRPARELLGALKEQRALPPEISEGLLGRILESEVCICSRSCPRGSDGYRALEKLRKDALDESVSEELWRLYTNLQPGNQVGFSARAAQGIRTLEQLREEDAGCTLEETDLESRRAELEDSVDESAEDELRKVKIRRSEIDAARRKSENDASILTQKIQSKRQALTQKDEQIRKTGGGGDHFHYLSLASDSSSDYAKLAKRCQEALVRGMHRELAKSVREMYASIVSDGSSAEVDRETLMPSISRAGVGGLFSGGGQSQVLLLCYLIALAELRKTINRELRDHFSVSIFRDQGFFMDSVFGQTQGDYKRGVAELLPQHMSQLVLLLAGQQWDENVEGGLSDAISNAYGFELVSPRQDLDEGDYTFEFRGKPVRLLKRTKPGEQAHTLIRQLS